MKKSLLLASLTLGASSLALANADYKKSMLSSENFNVDKAHVPGQLLIKMKPSFQAQSVSLLSKMGAKQVGTLANGEIVVAQFDIKESDDLLEVAKQINLDPSVEYVEANQIYTINKLPNDPKFDDLYGLNNLGANAGVVDADIDAPEAWDISTGSKETLVAVIDTGVDYEHEDIAPNYWTNPGESGLDAEGNDKRTNGIDDDGNGFVDDYKGWDFANNDNDPMDDNSHGTHCAGTIGAKGDDGKGVVGVAWDVSIVGVKFLTGSGSGTLDNAIRSIDYVSAVGAKISSNSWGGGGYSAAMEEAIQRNKEDGILFIAAAGNSGTNNDTRAHYPSSYPLDNVLAIAATDNKDNLAGFSCFGVEGVDVAAPGVNILSSIPGQGHKKYSGTSMATPHVSGVAALVASTYPEADYTYIKNRILNGSDPVASLKGKVATGARINAYNAVEMDTVPPAQVSNVAVVSEGIDSVTLNWAPVGDDGYEGAVKGYKVRVTDEQGVETETFVVGSQESSDFVVDGLSFNSTGSVRIAAVDNVGNVGGFSEAVSFETVKLNVIAENAADSMEGVEANGNWDVMDVDGRTVFTDSPEGRYGRNSTTYLKLPNVAIEGRDIAVGFQLKFDIEKKYDNAYFEVSMDGENWSIVQTYTGAMD